MDYNNISAKFKEAETEKDEEKLKILEKKMLLHQERITEITSHILKVYPLKTHSNEQVNNIKKRSLLGFNGMFAVESIEAMKLYYEEFKKQQENLPEKKRD